MSKYLKKIKSLKKISKSNVVSSKFLIAKKDNIKIYYAPFDYINPKAKIMIVGYNTWASTNATKFSSN